MAQIDLDVIKKITKDRNTVHPKVYSTYTVFTKNDEKFVQIDTYGKSDREFPGKISQSFQIDKEIAKFLISMLKNEFEI